MSLTLPKPVPPRKPVAPELEVRFPTPPEVVEEHERRVREVEQQLQLTALNTQLTVADAEVAEAARVAADAVWQPPIPHRAAAPVAAVTVTPDVAAEDPADASDDSEPDDDSMSESELGACLLGL